MFSPIKSKLRGDILGKQREKSNPCTGAVDMGRERVLGDNLKTAGHP